MVSNVTLNCTRCTDEVNWTRWQWYLMLHLTEQYVQMRLTEQDHSGIWCYTWLNKMTVVSNVTLDWTRWQWYPILHLTEQHHSGIRCYTWMNKMTVVSDVTLDCTWCTDEVNWTRSQWYPMLHLIAHDVQMRLTEQDDSGIQCYTWLYMMYRWG